jgi:hypothetical protein
MSTDQSAVPPRWADIFATNLLLVAHAFLVMYTIWASAGVVSDQEYIESRCRGHDLDCSDPWRTDGAWVAGGVSVVLLLVDIVVVIRRSMKRRRLFVVPLLCCIGQLVVIGALVAVSSHS